jgi:RimJ/RimL family protein N-acetyltransferase
MPLPAALQNLKTELPTARLLLRCPRKGDGALVHEAVIESLHALRAWPASLPWALQEPSVETSETYCRESAAAFVNRSSLVYLVFDMDGKLVASTSLHSINWNVPKFEVGFWCRSSRTGRGYTREAIAELVRYAFESLRANRVDALPDEQNTGSRKVCESVGMRLEGVLRNERVTPQGSLRNTCVYAAVRSGLKL